MGCSTTPPPPPQRQHQQQRQHHHHQRHHSCSTSSITTTLCHPSHIRTAVGSLCRPFRITSFCSRFTSLNHHHQHQATSAYARWRPSWLMGFSMSLYSQRYTECHLVHDSLSYSAASAVGRGFQFITPSSKLTAVSPRSPARHSMPPPRSQTAPGSAALRHPIHSVQGIYVSVMSGRTAQKAWRTSPPCPRWSMPAHTRVRAASL